jgi:subtilisin family serine protease
MATPHVAAAAALVAGRHPDWTPADTKEHLRANAAKVADMGGKTFTEELGAGLLDISALLASD